MKTCRRCNLDKNEDEYYTNGKRLRGECKPCSRLIQLASRYNTTPEYILYLYEKQNHKCAICKQPCSVYGNLSVDHDHTCCSERGTSCGNCIRGLLCSHCNHGLGCFMDNPKLLQEAIRYLGD